MLSMKLCRRLWQNNSLIHCPGFLDHYNDWATGKHKDAVYNTELFNLRKQWAEEGLFLVRELPPGGASPQLWWLGKG
jgi:hypothetical protein